MAEEEEEQEVQQDRQDSDIQIIPKRKEKAVEAAEKAITAVPRRIVEIETIRKEQARQPVMAAVKMYVQNKVLPKAKLMRIGVLDQAQFYEVNQAGLLCKVRPRRRSGSLRLDMQVLIPEGLRSAVIEGCEGTEGHASVLKTYQKVRDRFYWPRMFLDVQKFVKYCPMCNCNTDKRTSAPIKQHIQAHAPGETVVVDLPHFPKAKGHKYLLVAVGAYSRWGELHALPDKYAATIADAIVETLITNTSGGIKLIVSDQG